MLTSEALKKIVAEARPLIEQQMQTYSSLNHIFMSAWRAGVLDDAWADYRKSRTDIWLTYFIRARGMGDIKIGKSNQVRARLRALFTGASRGLDLVACYPAPISHEKELHQEFDHLRLCGEWFRPGRELLAHLRLVGCDVDAFTNAVPAHFFRQFPERMQ